MVDIKNIVVIPSSEQYYVIVHADGLDDEFWFVKYPVLGWKVILPGGWPEPILPFQLCPYKDYAVISPDGSIIDIDSNIYLDIEEWETGMKERWAIDKANKKI